MLTHLSLFSGIGGLDLAAEWAGFTTVGQCEWADYPTKVLEKHWPDVPRWRDIHDLDLDTFRSRTGLRTVDVISGGFPCQPFSVAGKQKGKGDERYLWPEMLRVIREVKPAWVVGENVLGILRIAAPDVTKGLEREGYNVVLLDYEAAAVGALHRRERIAFVGSLSANSMHNGFNGAEITGSAEQGGTASQTGAGASMQSAGLCECGIRGGVGVLAHRNGKSVQSTIECKDAARSAGFTNGGAMAHSGSEGLQRMQFSGARSIETGEGRARSHGATTERRYDGRPGTPPQWEPEPSVGRVAYGVPNRVDRLKCLGNAVVPQWAYPIFKAIAEIEED